MVDLTLEELRIVKAAMDSFTRSGLMTYQRYNLEAASTMKIHASIHEKLSNAEPDNQQK